MSQAATEYAYKTPQGGWRIADSRVSLDSVVHAYWEGKSPEVIADGFPTLSVEQVYGAIAFYLRHKSEIDEYLRRQEDQWQQLTASSGSQHGQLLDRLRNRRQTDSAE
jgi:uncharacterized protein (DUF433 family)